jgi:hypoxanthine phosphoribosyltransferase
MGENREVLLSAAEIGRRVDLLAAAIDKVIDDQTVAVCLLTGGLWFAADLMRALAALDRHPLFDAVRLSSYGEARVSSGEVSVLHGLHGTVEGRQVLLIDDVFDSGLSMSLAADLVRQAGAREVLSAVFARKPWPSARAIEPDFVGWDAPERFLVGYGMDAAGRFRGLPAIAALDD